MSATRNCQAARAEPPGLHAEPAPQTPPQTAPSLGDSTVNVSLLALARLLGRQAAREALPGVPELTTTLQRSAL